MATKAFSRTLEQTFQQLTQEINGQRRFVDNPPLLYHLPNQDEYFEKIRVLFEQYRETRLLFPPTERHEDFHQTEGYVCP